MLPRIVQSEIFAIYKLGIDHMRRQVWYGPSIVSVSVVAHCSDLKG